MPLLRRAVASICVMLGLMLAAGVAAAHDFWLVPQMFQLETGTTLTILGQTGIKFPESTSALAADRIAEARILGAGSDEPLHDFSVAGKSLVIAHRPATPGQRVVVATVQPTVRRLSAEAFGRYLAAEGAAHVVARYERAGEFPRDSVSMRSTKFAKAIVEVGRGGARAFSRSAGHALELIPITDVATLRARDTVAIRVLFHGRRLEGAHVHTGAASTAPHDAEASLPSDSEGIVRVPIGREGIWNVRLGFAAPTQKGEPGDWEVAWATLVFQVEAGRPSLRSNAPDAATSADSAAVAATLSAYHAAAVLGDSAAMLTMLSPDVVVLESGGLELREEFRRRHLPADVAFAQAVSREPGPLHVRVTGDVAWAASTNVTRGTFKGRAIDSAGAELMVLSRDASGRWRIRAIHWSSRRRAR